jgi:hypothetical protein
MRAGRLSKANQFLTAAELIAASIEDSDLADAFVTLCVHAGIAASDVICCAKMAVHHSGGNHNLAIDLLEQVDPSSAIHLKTLLDIKSHAGYSSIPISTAHQERARLAAQELLGAAQLA